MVSEAGSRSLARWLVLARACGLCSTNGFLAGGALGSVDRPVVGTFFGAGAGLVMGAVAGVILAPCLMFAARVSVQWVLSFTAAGLVGGGTLVVGGLFDHGSGLALLVLVAMTCLAGIAGALSGPLIVYGMEPLVLFKGAQVSVERVLRILLAGGAALGIACGGLIGLVIGLVSYAPTAPFAVVEGAIFGVVHGFLLSAVLFLLVLLPRLKPKGGRPLARR